jgi:hypothetical protein
VRPPQLAASFISAAINLCTSEYLVISADVRPNWNERGPLVRLWAIVFAPVFFTRCFSCGARSGCTKRTATPAMSLGIANHVWSLGELIDATLATVPPDFCPHLRTFAVQKVDARNALQHD